MRFDLNVCIFWAFILFFVYIYRVFFRSMRIRPSVLIGRGGGHTSVEGANVGAAAFSSAETSTNTARNSTTNYMCMYVRITRRANFRRVRSCQVYSQLYPVIVVIGCDRNPEKHGFVFLVPVAVIFLSFTKIVIRYSVALATFWNRTLGRIYAVCAQLLVLLVVISSGTRFKRSAERDECFGLNTHMRSRTLSEPRIWYGLSLRISTIRSVPINYVL